MSAAEAQPLTIVVKAKDLTVGDWVEPDGIVQKVDDTQRADPPLLVVLFKNDAKIFGLDDQVTIRLEDRGEDSD